MSRRHSLVILLDNLEIYSDHIERHTLSTVRSRVRFDPDFKKHIEKALGLLLSFSRDIDRFHEMYGLETVPGWSEHAATAKTHAETLHACWTELLSPSLLNAKTAEEIPVLIDRKIETLEKAVDDLAATLSLITQAVWDARRH